MLCLIPNDKHGELPLACLQGRNDPERFLNLPLCLEPLLGFACSVQIDEKGKAVEFQTRWRVRFGSGEVFRNGDVADSPVEDLDKFVEFVDLGAGSGGERNGGYCVNDFGQEFGEDDAWGGHSGDSCAGGAEVDGRGYERIGGVGLAVPVLAGEAGVYVVVEDPVEEDG